MDSARYCNAMQSAPAHAELPEFSMKKNTLTSPAWATASIGDTPDTSPMELSALGEHLTICRGHTGRLFTLQCLAETANGFVSSRFVTSLVVLTILIAMGSLVF